MRRITQTLEILARTVSETETDRYGNPLVTYPRPGADWPVYGVAPRGQAGLSEPFEANRDPIMKGVQVFAPVDGPRPSPHDRVWLWEQEWSVVGDVAVWDLNPHFPVTRQRGVVVNLDRAEG